MMVGFNFIHWIFGIILLIILIRVHMKKGSKEVTELFKDYFEFGILSLLVFFFFLGALQSTYQYETTFLLDINEILGSGGEAVISYFYELGQAKPIRWFITSGIVFIMSFYFFLLEPSISTFKKKNLSAKEISG